MKVLIGVAAKIKSFDPPFHMASSQDERSLRKLMKKTSLKRKLISGNSKPTKRQKVLKEEHKLDELDWKVVERPSAAGIDEDGGILTLEEVENVEVYYEETLKGRVAKFRQARFYSAVTHGHPLTQPR